MLKYYQPAKNEKQNYYKEIINISQILKNYEIMHILCPYILLKSRGLPYTFEWLLLLIILLLL